MSKKLQLSIPTPCHENWDAMSKVEKGKFCGSCQKQVVDFSNMSDRQVAEFFKKPSTGSVCGRFMTGQLDRSIDIPKKRIPWVRYFFQIALPAFFVTLKPSAQTPKGKVKVNTVAADTIPIRVTMGMIARPIEEPVKKDTAVVPVKRPVKGEIKIEKIDTTVAPVVCEQEVLGKVSMSYYQAQKEIKGRVIGEDGEPLVGATIMIKGTKTGMATDINGEFILRPGITIAKAVLVGSNIEYETTELAFDRNKYNGYITIQLKRLPVEYLVGELVVCYKPEPKKEIKNVPLMPAVIKDAALGAFKVFPNPVTSGSDITIEWKQTEEGYFTMQLLDQSGKQLNKQEIWIDAEARMLDIEVPVVPAGSYFLVMTNKKTGKKFTEKIIIQ